MNEAVHIANFEMALRSYPLTTNVCVPGRFSNSSRMDSTEADCNSEAFNPEEITDTVKTMLIQSIALNNSEGFSMALEALEEFNVGLNWSAHSNSLVLGGDNWNTPLNLAAKLGRVSMITTLIEKGADPNLFSHHERGKSTGQTALHVASKSGKIEVVDCLLMHGCDVNVADTRGWTPLHNAICEDNIDVAFKLLENGADPRQGFSISLPDVKNFAVVGRASLMFSAGPYRLHLTEPPSFEWNCLSFATNCHQPQLVEKLIQEYFHKDVDLQSTLGKTLLHEAVILPENLNLNEEIAIQKRLETMKILLKAGVSPNIQDHMGKTALHLFFDHVNLAKEVVRKYSKIVPQTIRLLQDCGAHLNVEDVNGRTVLHQAAAFGDLETVQVLLELGANVTSQDRDGNTPAHVAANHRNFQVLQYLLDCALHAEFINRHGDTVLHVAIKVNASEDALLKIAQTLKCKSEEKFKVQVNVYGESEFDLAVKCKLERLSHLLSCHVDSAVSANATSDSQTGSVEAQFDNGVRTTDEESEILWDGNRSSETYARSFDDENDFDVCCDNAEIPELLIEADTNVNEYLLKLCHEYRIRSLHMDGQGKCHERCTVAKQTMEFVQKLLELAAEDDERFNFKVLCTGSAFEGYRIGKPDEFDYMCELKSLTDDKCEILETEQPGFVRLQVKEHFREEWQMFLSEDGFLDAMKVKCYLANVLCSKSNTADFVHDTWKLRFNTTSYDACVLCHPLISTSKAGLKMTLFWTGNVYKFMPIDIDITPAIHFPNWPSSAKAPPSHVLKGCTDFGYHVVPKSDGADSCLWRLSFSVAELKILQNLGPVQGACYTALKIIKGQTMLRSCAQHFSHLGFLHTYVLKTKFFEELEQCENSELWQQDKLTDRVCSVLESTARLLKQKGSSWVESYFLPGHNIMQQADKHFGKLVAASVKTTVRNVIRLLRKEPGSPVETNSDGSFTMKFDLDSSSESDNDSNMEFANPGNVAQHVASKLLSTLCLNG